MGHCLFLRKGEVHTAPVTGVLASSLTVGSTVKLMEGGTAVEYLVVNQGIPSNSSLYDTSCDGTWLLRKDCHSKMAWNSNANANTYASSSINTWLNGEFFNSLGAIEQTTINQVKIPYCVGAGNWTINSGANGLSVKSFLLCGVEVGFFISSSNFYPNDGSKLDFFEEGRSEDLKRISQYNGEDAIWMLRSPCPEADNYNAVHCVLNTGSAGMNYNTKSLNAIRPALILPGNALFDKTTMLLKGVK